MSDAQFVAANPDSDLVRPARRTLREIKAAAARLPRHQRRLRGHRLPGGLRAGQADPRRGARRRAALLLRAGQPRDHGRADRQLPGGLRRHPPGLRPQGHPVRDARHLRRRHLRGGGFDQVARATRRARHGGQRRDGRLGRGAVPPPAARPRPRPRRSQLGDRKEAALVEKWLADFERAQRQRAPASSARTSAPSTPSGSTACRTSSTATRARRRPPRPSDGGFTGWTMFGVDPVTPAGGRSRRGAPAAPRRRTGSTRRSARTSTTLTLTAPAAVAVGTPAPVSATVTQGGRTVPVAYAGGRGLVGLAEPPHRRGRAGPSPGTSRCSTRRPERSPRSGPGPVVLARDRQRRTRQATVALTARQGGRLLTAASRQEARSSLWRPGLRPSAGVRDLGQKWPSA